MFRFRILKDLAKTLGEADLSEEKLKVIAEKHFKGRIVFEVFQTSPAAIYSHLFFIDLRNTLKKNLEIGGSISIGGDSIYLHEFPYDYLDQSNGNLFVRKQ